MPSTPDERAPIVVVPTELDRRNPFYDLVALGFVIVTVKYLHQFDLHWWAVPLAIAVGVWALSGEPATDVAFVGLIASAFRNKLGLRRAHEWLFAFAHYWYVAVRPRWKDQWHNSRLRSAMVRTLTRLPRLPRVSGARLSSKRLLFWSKP